MAFPLPLPGGLGQFQANGWEHLRWREMISTLISTEIPLLRMDTTPQMKERTYLHLDCFISKAILNLQQQKLEIHDLDIKIKSENKLILTKKKVRIFELATYLILIYMSVSFQSRSGLEGS